MLSIAKTISRRGSCSCVVGSNRPESTSSTTRETTKLDSSMEFTSMIAVLRASGDCQSQTFVVVQPLRTSADYVSKPLKCAAQRTRCTECDELCLGDSSVLFIMHAGLQQVGLLGAQPRTRSYVFDDILCLFDRLHSDRGGLTLSY